MVNGRIVMTASAPHLSFPSDDSRILSELPDEDVYEMLCAGDQTALHVLFDRHVRMLRRLAMNILHDAGESEDVAQEVFVTLWRNKDAWERCSAKFSTWLHRVAINKAIDHRRRRRATPESAETLAAISDASSARACQPMDQDAAVDHRDRSEAVRALMLALPRTQQKALALYYFEDNDVSEIAAQMGISELAVRALLKRARGALRERLSEDGDRDARGVSLAP